MGVVGYLLVGLICLGVGVAAGFLVERVRQGAAYRSRDEIIKQAEVEASNLIKSRELTAKEDLLKRRESMEREIQNTREELREVERKLDRREIVLNEQVDDIQKKERMLELTQHKLADRSKALEVRERELERVLG
jgi:ribonuclease Y